MVLEVFKHQMEHFSVITGHAYQSAKAIRLYDLQGSHNGSWLDDFVS
jgi:hypothetical protein